MIKTVAKILEKTGSPRILNLSNSRGLTARQAATALSLAAMDCGRQGLPQPERLLKLNEIAISQMRTLLSANSAKRLK